MRHTSLVIRIGLALAGIVALAAVTMVSSYWISDRADSHAYAINLAGSLRMNTYRLGLLTQAPGVDPAQIEAAHSQLEQSWSHQVLTNLRQARPSVADAYDKAQDYWQELEPNLRQNDGRTLQAQLDRQVALIDQLVSQIQLHSEANAQLLRLIQVIALLAILLLAAIVIYGLKVKVEQPLSELTRMAGKVGRGDFSGRVELNEMDELGVLGESFNRMSHAIANMHAQMEERIDQQTLELQRSNTTLQFLYDIAKSVIEQDTGRVDYRPIVSRLAELVEADDVELCLITETGDNPYLQIKPEQSELDVCVLRDCSDCLTGELRSGTQYPGLTGPVCRYSFPMNRENHHYGVLVSRMGEGKALENWQQQLLQSVADQLAMALSLQAQEDNARRLSLAQERTVIARELHDSLAQALSYLKIQVTRLNRALEKQDQVTLEDVSKELQEGLSTAYRQLRELLTTFRLKVDGPGLLEALQSSVKQLNEQTSMEIELNYGLSSLPLTPNEEIHLLQVVREATQNAIHHSGGSKVKIQLWQDEQKQVKVSIEDDGEGIPEQPEKLNHYGMAIMQERSKNLGGELQVRNHPKGGTGVYFDFLPECRKQSGVFARQG